MMIAFRFTFIGLEPDVDFATTMGVIIFAKYIPVSKTTMSSVDMPASINFNFDKWSAGENPIFSAHVLSISIYYTRGKRRGGF